MRSHAFTGFASLLGTAIVGATLLSSCAAAGRDASQTPPAAASAATTGASQDPAPPLGIDWIFVAIDGFDGPLPSPPPVAGFIMTREGGRLTGTTGCNRMGSGYRLDVAAGTLEFTGLTNTRMMCDRVAADTEEAVLDAMIATDAFRLADDGLELWAKGKRVARLARPNRQ